MADEHQDGLTRRRLLELGGTGAASLALMGATAPNAATQAPRARNVVVIVLDNVRADHIGAYGARRVKTPSIDALARQSLRFTEFRPEVFPTIPARRSIMTGQRVYPFRGWRPTAGLPQEPGWEPIARGTPTFTDVLRRAGYRTGYVTDNPHILLPPFDSFRARFDDPVGVAGQVPPRRAPSAKVSAREVRRNVIPRLRGTSTGRRLRNYLQVTAGQDREQDYNAPRVFTEASRWLERAVRAEKPFALVVDSFDPHEPWDPPESYIRRYGKGRAEGVKPIQPFLSPGSDVGQLRLSRAVLDRARNLYAAELTLVDAWLGRFLTRLNELGLADDTLIVLASDHGVMLGERGFIGKSDTQMYREITHVPLLIRDPGGRRAGATSDYLAQTHDIGPTVLSFLGRQAPRVMDGADLSPLFAGGRARARSHQTASYGDKVSVSTSRWLLIADNQGRDKRLFDRRRDPGERRNVARRNPRVVRRLWRQVVREAGGKRLPRFR
jgi:arylsulfatase A-like enzyme